jgi:Domain of unknown function (DUF4232)
MFRVSRRCAVLVAVSCALTFAAVSPSASLAATPRCSTGNLTLEFVRSSAALSHRFWDLALRNVGPVTCQLRGYPGIGLLNSSARLMNVHVARRSGFPVRTVVLGPWRASYFTFGYAVSAPCTRGIFPWGIQVFPPNNAQYLRMYRRFDVCAGSTPVVYPVRSSLAL